MTEQDFKQGFKCITSGAWYINRLPTIEDLGSFEIGTYIDWNKFRIYRDGWEKVQPDKWCSTSPRGIKTYTDTNGVLARLMAQYDKYKGNFEHLLIQIT